MAVVRRTGQRWSGFLRRSRPYTAPDVVHPDHDRQPVGAQMTSRASAPSSTGRPRRPGRAGAPGPGRRRGHGAYRHHGLVAHHDTLGNGIATRFRQLSPGCRWPTAAGGRRGSTRLVAGPHRPVGGALRPPRQPGDVPGGRADQHVASCPISGPASTPARRAWSWSATSTPPPLAALPRPGRAAG